jgi:GNAT superfamily N-acetyltransferase
MHEPILRQADVTDAPTLARHRTAMFVEMGRLDAADFDLMAQGNEDYLLDAMPRGEFVAFVLEVGGEPVASGGVQLRTLLPRPSPDRVPLTTLPQGIIMGIYTETHYRRRGAAQSIMRAIMAWAETEEIPSLVLHASDAGRPLYEKLGFKQTSEMSYFVGTFDYALRE